jgi:hypothetical protein
LAVFLLVLLLLDVFLFVWLLAVSLLGSLSTLFVAVVVVVVCAALLLGE